MELRAVCKQHGQTRVIDDLSVSVPVGQCVGIIGSNGAGKSTLLDLISGRQSPSSGEVYFGGRRINGLPAFEINRLGLARSFQISQLFGGLSVCDNLRCGLMWHQGLRYSPFKRLSVAASVNQQTEQLLAQLNLESLRNTRADALSYADQRRLDLGITLASQAQLVLLDEPTAGLSRTEADNFVQSIRTLTIGKTLLIVEHDMQVIFQLSDKIAVLAQGRLLAFGAPGVVRADPQVQAAYLGASAC